MKNNICYIAGKISGIPRKRVLRRFEEAEEYLTNEGFIVLKPTVLPLGMDYVDYMQICYSMLEVADNVYMLSNWRDSPGADAEHRKAKQLGKHIIYEEKFCYSCKFIDFEHDEYRHEEYPICSNEESSEFSMYAPGDKYACDKYEKE